MSRSATVHVCASKANGALRATAHCRASERGLDLGEQGPVGSQGPTGPKGDTGPQGVPGNSGMSNYQIVKVSQDEASAGTYSIEVDCPSITSALGGGGDSTNLVTLNGITPGFDATPVLTPHGFVTVKFTTTAASTLNAYAICASVSAAGAG